MSDSNKSGDPKSTSPAPVSVTPASVTPVPGTSASTALNDPKSANSETHPPTVDNPARTPETHVGDTKKAVGATATTTRPVPVVPGTPGVEKKPEPAPAPRPTTTTTTTTTVPAPGTPVPTPAPKK